MQLSKIPDVYLTFHFYSFLFWFFPKLTAINEYFGVCVRVKGGGRRKRNNKPPLSKWITKLHIFFQNDNDKTRMTTMWVQSHSNDMKRMLVFPKCRQAGIRTDRRTFIHSYIHTCIRSLVQLKWTDGHLNSHTCMYYDATTIATAVAVATRTSTTTTMRTSEVVRIVVAVMFVGDISLNIRQKAVSSTHTHTPIHTHSLKTNWLCSVTDSWEYVFKCACVQMSSVVLLARCYWTVEEISKLFNRDFPNQITEITIDFTMISRKGPFKLQPTAQISWKKERISSCQ